VIAEDVGAFDFAHEIFRDLRKAVQARDGEPLQALAIVAMQRDRRQVFTFHHDVLHQAAWGPGSGGSPRSVPGMKGPDFGGSESTPITVTKCSDPRMSR